MPLIEEASKAARALLDHAYVRIVARCDPDAICAAALLAHALRRESVDFHVSWTRRLDEAAIASLAQDRADCLVVIGLSGDAAADTLPAARVLVLESGRATLAGEAVVQEDASLASLAHLVAAGLSKRNVDLAPLAVAGTLAAWRDLGGAKGLDAEILQEATASRILLRENGLALHGTTLAHAIGQLDAPFVAGLTGRARNVKKLLADLQLQGDPSPHALAPQEAERLGTFLGARLLQQRAPDVAFDALFRPTLRGLAGPHTGLAASDLARVAEAGCMAGRCGLAFSALWPDAASGGEALDLASAGRDELVAALLRAERDARREGRLVVAEAPRAGLAQPLADRLAIGHAPADSVVLVHAPDAGGAFLAIRTWATHVDAVALARRAGGPAAGDARHAHAWVADATHAVKAIAEALA